MNETGYCFVPEDEDHINWVMVPMADLRPGDLFKFVVEDDIVAIGLGGERPLPEHELDAKTQALRDLVMLAPIMRYTEPRVSRFEGCGACQAVVW